MDHEFIRELFARFRPVTVRRMFGGAGLFCEGLMFGLVFDGAIFLKVDDASIPDFEHEGSRPFVYTRAKSPGRVGRHSLSYWRLPERLYDDPDDLVVWAERAFAIAERKKAAPRAQVEQKRVAAKPVESKRAGQQRAGQKSLKDKSARKKVGRKQPSKRSTQKSVSRKRAPRR
jgi:DNA transformation protein